MAPDTRVRCCECGRSYATTYLAFGLRTCRCPDCGSSKAQMLEEQEQA